MEPELQYNFRDLLRLPLAAFRFRLIAIMTVAILAAIAVFDLFTYLAVALSDNSVATVWSAYSIFPFAPLDLDSWLPLTIRAIGLFFSIITIMLGSVAVALFRIESARGNPFTSARQALTFAWERRGRLIWTMVAMLLMFAAVVFLFWLVGWLTRLPFVGEIQFTIFFAIPYFLIGLGAILLLALIMIAVPLLPAVVAAGKRSDTFTTFVETISAFLRQPARWVSYTLFSVVAAKLCSFVYAYAAYRAVQFVVWASSLSGGERVERLVRSGLSHLPVSSDVADFFFSLFPGCPVHVRVASMSLSSQSTTSHLMSLMLLVIFTTIVAYFLVMITVGQAQTYIIIKRRKDDYCISDEPSIFFTPQHINDKVDEEVE
jgi:hypothetical protein